MIDLANDIIPVHKLRESLGRVVESVSEGERVVVITTQGAPTAALVGAEYLQSVLSELEAYRNRELIHLANQADSGPTLTLAETREFLTRRKAERRTARRIRAVGAA